VEFLEVLKKRKSTRKFLDKDVPQSKINELIELANSSPSAGNVQARAVVVVKDQNLIHKIKEVSKGLSRFEGTIPVILVILAKIDESAGKYEDRGRNLYGIQDATIFAAYLQLIATEKGLSTCWVGSFIENEIVKMLNLENGVKPIALVPLGFAAEEPAARERKSLNEIIFKEI
jgi:nitroreductase